MADNEARPTKSKKPIRLARTTEGFLTKRGAITGRFANRRSHNAKTKSKTIPTTSIAIIDAE